MTDLPWEIEESMLKAIGFVITNAKLDTGFNFTPKHVDDMLAIVRPHLAKPRPTMTNMRTAAKALDRYVTRVAYRKPIQG